MIIEYIKSLYNKVKKTEIKPSYIEGSMKNVMNLLQKINLDFKKCDISLEKNYIELKYIDRIVDNANNDIELYIIFEITYNDDKTYSIFLRYDRNSIGANMTLYNYRSKSNIDNAFEIKCIDKAIDIKWVDIITFFENLNDLKQRYLYETFLLNMKTEYKILRDEKLEILLKTIENDENKID